MKTFSLEHWRRSAEEWRAGEFSAEWVPFRAAAREAGIIYPPTGTAFDSWEDEAPSQRAILIREIRDRPKALLKIIRHSRSWSDVVAQCISGLERRRNEVDEQQARDEAKARARREDRATDAEALASIMARIRP
jgi:hypothetical protein